VQELSGLDARFLYSETRAAHMHTLKIIVKDLSARPDELTTSELVAMVEARLDRVPVLRRRAVPVPYRLGHPVWVEAPGFDIQRQVHWRVAGGAGTERDLAAIVAEVAAEQLPRDRPLWDLTVVEGLEGDQVAFVMKLHHSLADGGAAVALLENAFVLDDADAYVEPAHPEPVPSDQELMRQALVNGSRRALGVPGLLRRTASGILASRRAQNEVDVSLPAYFSGPRTSFNASLVPERTFAMTGLDLQALLSAKKAAGATLNDVFLAVCGGALRRYLDRRGELPERGLVAGVPMATGPSEVHYSGNHLDNLALPVGTDIADPVERIRLIHAATVAGRKVRVALGPELFEGRAALTPPMLYPVGIRLWARTRLADRTRPPINLIASNVRGPADLPTMDGAKVTALYSMGPILEGIGLNVTAWSFQDQLDVSVMGTPGTLADPWDLIDDLHVAAAELTRSLGVSR
jgi:diacylglycerol O-acyltransferase